MKKFVLAVALGLMAASVAHAQTAPPQTQIHQPWEIMTDEAVGKGGQARPSAISPAGGLIDGLELQLALDLLTAAGVKGEIISADGGRFIVASIDQAQFQATPILCNDAQKACAAMRLSLALASKRKPPLDLMNAWNNAAPMARAFLDQEGDPVMEMDISVEGGVSRAHVLAQLTRWRGAMSKFQSLIAAQAQSAATAKQP